MNNSSDGNISLSLSDMVFVLWKAKKKIILVSLVGFFIGIGMIIINGYIIDNNPQYTVSSAIAVNSQNATGKFASNSVNPNYQDVSLAEDLADSVIYVATSGKVLNTVINNLQLVNITPENLRDALKLSQYEESQIIQISFKWDNPDEGVQILSEITKVLPEYLIDTLKIGSVTIVDEPTTAEEVGNTFNLLTAIIVGGIFFGGITCIYIVNLILYPTFLTGKSIIDSLGIEVIGEIPKADNLSMSISFRESFGATTNILLYLLKKRKDKIILITSTWDEEGKTTVTMNLGQNIADLGNRVLLIECDFRKPSLGRLLPMSIDEKHTLNAVYNGEIASEKAIVEVKNNLYVLPCFLDRRQLIIDQVLVKIIEELATKFDYVFLDTPPVGIASEVMRLNEVVDSTVFVIRQNKVWQEIVTDSVERLMQSGFTFVGCILNDINVNTPGNKYYHKNYKGEQSTYTGRKWNNDRGSYKRKKGEELKMKNKKFVGKTLLILGSNIGAVDIINYAKAHGAYTIVADNLLLEESKAKQIADKSLFISTADMDELIDVVKRYKVDGVLTGISEFNILQAMKLAEETGIAFYCKREQREMLESKECFRDLCLKYNVSSPKTFFVGEEFPYKESADFEYPVVVKPVDGTTSKGVYFCENEKELALNWPQSKTASAKGKVIIEEKVSGAEFTTIYLLVGGKAKLASIDNRYGVSVNPGNVTTIPVARIYPSLFIDEYMKQMNESVLKLCEGTGIQNGIIMMQGIYNKESNKFYMFEAGLRCSAEAPYRFISQITGHSFIEILVDQVLLGKSDYPINTEDPYHHGKVCGIVSLVGKGGTVGAINGLEEAIKEIPSIVTYENRYDVGSVVPNGNTLHQLMIRFIMICKSREELSKDIERLNEMVSVLSVEGENMVIKCDPQAIYDIG